ncbi:hypothetical protein A9G11_13190 [Gilliamella sp. wkB108]|uniref:glycosyltransferase family 2 protein n=1 Tax=Gilliamella sp. wkB108 TaxID=3120256 RepID=UPI00080EB272|nr:glycosyltransferase family 2 protein [Gilliamella apicola]OCG26845.1 hypothetical protein A9G11_13190 [Gilliamella apicola]
MKNCDISSNVITIKEEFLVSILLTIYNVDKYLEECLDSILAQSYKNLEVVCVDNGSLDRCGEILLKYQKKDPRIKIITLQDNRMLCGGRNVSLDNATGDFICFVDPDDWVEKDWIKSMVAAIEQLDPEGEKYNLVINHNAIDYIVEEESIKIIYKYADNTPCGDYTIQDYNNRTEIETNVPMWGRLYRKKFLDQLSIRFIEGFQTDNIPYTTKLLAHMKHFYIMSDNNANNNYWRRLFMKDISLTNVVLFKNFEIPEALENLYDYLKINGFENKVKVMFYNFFKLCFYRHIDQPRYYLAFKKLMMKMENTIKDNPEIYSLNEMILCNILIYSEGFFDFLGRYNSVLGETQSQQTYEKKDPVLKLFGFIPLYKKKADKNSICYYILGIPTWKIKIKNNKYIYMYLFNFIRVLKKY